MKRLFCLLSVGLAAGGCGDATTSPDGAGDRPSVTGEAPEQSADALHLSPRLELVGLGDVFEALVVTHLAFEADLYVLPDELDETTAGDAVGIRFQYDDGRATTRVVRRDLRLDHGGTYRVLVRVRPNTNGTSVTVGGEYLEALGSDTLGADGQPRAKADQEPAPSPAEPAPSPADGTGEPAPSPADEAENDSTEGQPASDPTAPAEPAPSPAEPAPSPAEPAPSPAEPAPSPADEADDGSSAEPAPSPAEPAPSPARAKTDDGLDLSAETSAPVFVRSQRAFDFYAGTVEVRASASELVVTWDVRSWLRAMLADPLGIPRAENELSEGAGSKGLGDIPPDFRVESR